MKQVPLVIIWAVAFAYVESSVVEYLRALYHPLSTGGFQFPLPTLHDLRMMGPEHERRLIIELGREFSTLIMPACVGLMAGKNARESWAHFLIAFGVWDIFYYIWLRIFIDWPQSLMTWDLLFLLPVPWVSPVTAPVLISLVMIASGITILLCESRNKPLRTRPFDWVIFTLGGVIVIVSFCWDYRVVMNGGIPLSFPWAIFLIGLIVGVQHFISVVRRNSASYSCSSPDTTP